MLKKMPQLRYLQFQVAHINQTVVSDLAALCPRLETLIITSTRFDDAGVDLSVLDRILELALPDAYLGLITRLPRRVKSFTATIMAIDNHCSSQESNTPLTSVSHKWF